MKIRRSNGIRIVLLLAAFVAVLPLYFAAISHSTRILKSSYFTSQRVRQLDEDPIDDTILMLFSSRSGTDARGAYTTVSNAFLGESGHANSSFFDFFNNTDATFWVLSPDKRTAHPLRFDVVFTHVSTLAASFFRDYQKRNVTYMAHNFRDWGELRYALRSVYRFAHRSRAFRQYHRRMREDTAWLESRGVKVALPNLHGSCTPSLIRQIYLLVPNEDHVPSWLDALATGNIIRVVTHRELYTSEEQRANMLPTFSSPSIETTLHRIPGLSAFFWYFNNDMLIGRRVSLFDLFRPLSPRRQELHSRMLCRCTGRCAEWPRAGERLAVWMETFFVNEGTMEHLSEAAKDPFEKKTHFLSAHYLEGLPAISHYAHTPLLINKRVISTLVDNSTIGFAYEASCARKSFTRDQQSFSLINFYVPYALAMRRAYFIFLHRNFGLQTPVHVVGTRSDRVVLQATTSLDSAGSNPARVLLGSSLPPRRELLLADVAHHQGARQHYRLVMVENYIKLAVSAAAAEKLLLERRPFLFTTVNDDLFDSSVPLFMLESDGQREQQQRQQEQLMRHFSPENTALARLFEQLLRYASADENDPAPWEVK